MCRIVAYYGPPVPLSKLILEPPHGLLDQSQHAREMTDSQVAGDGWGAGWIGPGGEPGLLKSNLPLWSCPNATTVTPAVSASLIVGHIRLASPGSEICFLNTPLYRFGEHLYTLNGELKPWPGPLSLRLRECLHEDDQASLQGSTDGEAFGALWNTHLRQTGDPAAALRGALAQACELCEEFGGSVKVNVIVAGKWGFLAVRFAQEGEPNSLYYHVGEAEGWPALRVASEPLEDRAGWKRVAPSTLVRADAGGIRLEALELGKGADGSNHRGRRVRA